jgi:hypothetical protein
MLISFLHRRGIRLPRWIGVTILVLMSLALVSGLVLAQSAPYAMVYRAGNDTVGVERVTPSPGLVLGEIQLRGQPRIQWSAAMRAPGIVQQLTLTAFQNASPDAPLLQRAVLTLEGDSVRAELSGQGRQLTQRFKTTRDALIYQPQSIAMLDMVLIRARAAAGAVDSIPLFLASGGQTIPAVVTLDGARGTIVIGPGTSSVTLNGAGFVESVSVPAQRLEVTRVEGAALAALRVGGPNYDAPAGAPYRAEHVKIPATGGHTLAATLTVPMGAAERLPVVVTISGSGGQDRDSYLPVVPGYRPFRQYADSLGRRGVATLRFDDRGVGESTGDHGRATSADFADDVRSVVAWLRARADIDPARIFLMGHSEGGMIAPMVAAGDSRLAGIVLLAGTGATGEQILRFQLRNAYSKAAEWTPTQRDSALKTIDATIATLRKDNAWMRFFFDHDPIATARQVKVPVFVVQGATDQQVTADQASLLDRAFRVGGNQRVSVKVLDARNHLFLEDADGTPANYIKLPTGRIPGDVIGPVVEWILGRANGSAR